MIIKYEAVRTAEPELPVCYVVVVSYKSSVKTTVLQHVHSMHAWDISVEWRNTMNDDGGESEEICSDNASYATKPARFMCMPKSRRIDSLNPVGKEI